MTASESALRADLAVLERRLAWSKERAPKAHALQGRIWTALGVVLDEEKRGNLENIALVVGAACRNGVEIDEDFEREADETLGRAWATVKR